MKAMRCKRVELEIWRWHGLVCQGGSREDFQAFVKRVAHHEITLGAHSCGHAFVAYGEPWLLWVGSLDDVASLAHEALHITSGVLEGRGMKWTNEGEEAYTYTMAHIIRCALARTGWCRADSYTS